MSGKITASLVISVLALVVSGASLAYFILGISPIAADLNRVSAELSDIKTKLGAATQEQALVEAAKAEKTLVLYGPVDAPAMNGIIWARFKVQYPWAELKYTVGFGPLMAKFVQESKTGVSTADVVMQTNTALILGPIVEGQTVAFSDNKHKGLYPTAVLDAESRYYSVFASPCVAVYNTNKVAVKDLPKQWMDLTDPKWKSKMAFPLGSSWGACLAELHAQMGEATWDQFTKGLAANSPVIAESATQAYQMVVQGEKDIGIVLVNDLITQSPDTPVRAIWFQPIPFIPQAVAVAKNAQHPNLAKLFVEWLTGPEGQASIAASGRIPILAGVPSPLDKIGGIPAGINLVSGTNADALKDPNKWLDREKKIFGLP